MPQLSDEEYHSLANAVLVHYQVEVEQIHFLRHNAGIAFRVDCRVDSQQPYPSFLLKIHTPVGEWIGEWVNSTPEIVLARHTWLRALAQNSGLVVQTPVPNRQGELLTTLAAPDGKPPYLCTLQQWVEGDWPGGHYNREQLQRIGEVIARIHQFSSECDEMSSVIDALPLYEVHDLDQEVETLRLAVDAALLTEQDYTRIEAASKIVLDFAQTIGRERQHWGPVHGDFHHGNLIFDQDEARLIDFDCLCLGPYAADLSVMLYHVYYQGPTLYAALLQGYQAIRPLPFESTRALEAFMTRAAISNLAFNATIPEQYEQPYLSRNLRQLVDEFCLPLLADERFLQL